VIKLDNDISPTANEVYCLQTAFGSLSIQSKEDVISLQNRVINTIYHGIRDNMKYPLDINSVILGKRGLCYDRSLILQKIMLLNGIRIRPVYIFFNIKTNHTSYVDLLFADTDSHAVFEFEWDGVWYMCQTTTKMVQLLTIDEYLNSNVSLVPKHSKYIRHVSNLNCKFIGHWFIPDIY
jgi:hypothetical protein